MPTHTSDIGALWCHMLTRHVCNSQCHAVGRPRSSKLVVNRLLQRKCNTGS